MKRAELDQTIDRMAGSCLMMRSRLIGRVMRQMYDEELSEYGIKASQLTPLIAIARYGPLRRTDLGRALHLDVSTLTRNLRVMQENGWIAEESEGSDGRGAPVRITREGETLIGRLAPAWERAQQRATRVLSGDGVSAVTRVSNQLLRLA